MGGKNIVYVNNMQELNTKELTLEQSLQLRNFKDTMQKASKEQTFDMLIFTYVELLNQKNSYIKLLKQAWGL